MIVQQGFGRAQVGKGDLDKLLRSILALLKATSISLITNDALCPL